MIRKGTLGSSQDHVDLFGVRFPRLSQKEALDTLSALLQQPESAAVCFPDMSTLNLLPSHKRFADILRSGRILTFNDGAGLALSARLRRRPFPANLNGTDLCPALLERAQPGTGVYLLGARPGVAERAAKALSARFPHLRFVGHHHGFLDATSEAQVVATLRELRPRIVFVAMGNPLQVELIDRYLADPSLKGILWLAVGGQLDYYGGSLTRAPGWMRTLRLEWLHIVRSQPYKARRYFFGIPRFLLSTMVTELRGGHERNAK